MPALWYSSFLLLGAAAAAAAGTAAVEKTCPAKPLEKALTGATLLTKDSRRSKRKDSLAPSNAQGQERSIRSGLLVNSSCVKDLTSSWFSQEFKKKFKCAVWNTCNQDVTLKCKGSACTQTLGRGGVYLLKCNGKVSTQFCTDKSQCEVAAASAPLPPGIKTACLPVSTSTADAGYNDAYRGWYDVQGCGRCNDYCRWVGNSGSGGNPRNWATRGTSWWSCRLAGSTSPYTGKTHFKSWSYAKCSGPGSAAPTLPLKPEKKELLAAHNLYRCMHGVPVMSWNEKIAKAAQQWADATRGAMQHSPKSRRSNVGGHRYLGENLAMGRMGAGAVKMWYDEIDQTNPRGIVKSFSSGTGHYTQVVWKASLDLGCGQYERTTVCMYGPGGNMMNDFEANVFAPVKTEAECRKAMPPAPRTPTPSPPAPPPPAPRTRRRRGSTRRRRGSRRRRRRRGGIRRRRAIRTRRRGTIRIRRRRAPFKSRRRRRRRRAGRRRRRGGCR